MQMHESKANTTRNSTSSSSSVKLSFSSSGGANNNSGSSGLGGNTGCSGAASLPSFNNNQVTSSANNHTSSSDKQKGKKKSNRDRQTANDDKSTMSNISYPIEDDYPFDDQEQINVGNLIMDLESDLEKDKFENEQANSANNNDTDPKSSTNPISTTSSTSPIAMPSSSSSSSTSNKSSNNNNNNSIKSLNHSIESRTGSKSNQKPTNKHQKESVNPNSLPNPTSITVNNGHLSTRTVFKTSADDRGELKMKITRETKPNKSEHKVVTSPPLNSGGTSNNDLSVVSRGNNYDISIAHETIPSAASISSTKECGTSTSIGTITEPECLGPCEPGTSVNLEGIVWQETDGGILVVNVTWRGKTYVGALLDCTRHDWAPPRLCDSPASDIDAKASKGVRAKRIVTRSNGIGLDEKNLLQTTGKLRNGKGRRIPSASETSSCSKKGRETSEKASENPSAQSESNTQQANMSLMNSETAIVPMNVDATNGSQQETQAAGTNPSDETGPISPMLIGCNEPNCSKKFRNMNGLLYHQSHAHSAENESASTQDDCSSSTKDKDATTVIEEPPSDNSGSPVPSNDHDGSNTNDFKGNRDEKREHLQQQHQMQNMLQQGMKRERTASPELSVKISNRPHNDTISNISLNDNRLSRNESPRISYVKGMDPERRHSSSSTSGGLHKGSESHRSPHSQQKHHSHEHHGSSTSHSLDQHTSSSSSFQTSKPHSQNTKQSLHPPSMLPATTEEGMKPSGTSTGPPPAPHQANCYFNPAFLANNFNPYGLPPYSFPRHMYDPLAPPNIPTSNAAFLARFMNNMRVPPPSDSPSRLLSPSMRAMPPTGPAPHPLPNMSPLSNPSLPPGPLPPIPTLPPLPPIMGGSANLRMPSQGDPLLPPSSQPPFMHPTGINPALGLPGIGNPLGPMGGPQVPSLVDDALAKQFPRRFN